MITIPQRHGQADGQTDGQTTCRSNAALCVASRGKTDKITVKSYWRSIVTTFEVSMFIHSLASLYIVGLYISDRILPHSRLSM